MAISAVACRVFLTGTSTSMTSEACAGSGSSYQITNTAKRIIDPGTALEVYANGVLQASTTYTVDYLFGKIKFAGTPTAPITVTGAYLPTLEITDAKSWSVDISREPLDTTRFHSSNVHRTRIVGLKSCSGTISVHDDGDTDYDSGAGTLKLSEILTGGGLKVVEFSGLGNSQSLRAFFRAASVSPSTAVEGQTMTDFGFDSVAGAGAVSFGFSDDTLP